MKKLACLLFLSGAALALAQDTSADAQPPAAQSDEKTNMLTSLAGQFFDGNFVNIYAFGNGVYDSTREVLGNGTNTNNGSAGFDLGGGVTLSHEFSSSLLSLNYRGDYRDFSGGSSYLGSGTSQYLSFQYAKTFGRRWTLSVAEAGGILLFGQGFYTTDSASNGIVNNPFSPETRFSSTSVYLSYRATRRLTYTLGGSLFLNRYNYSGAIGSTGGIYSASATYQLTPLTSVSGTYAHDDFYFQHGFGESHIDSLSVSAHHRFLRNWTVTGAVGATRANTAGVITVPVTFLFPNGETVTGYETGHYNTTKIVPTLQGGISHTYRRYTFSASAGRGVTPGNGTILTSTNTNFGGYFSRAFHNSNLGAGSYYNHITSIANKVASDYSQTSINISYSHVIVRHVSANVAYAYFRYGSFLQYGSSNDNRLFFGVSFSTKSVPLTLF